MQLKSEITDLFERVQYGLKESHDREWFDSFLKYIRLITDTTRCPELAEYVNTLADHPAKMLRPSAEGRTRLNNMNETLSKMIDLIIDTTKNDTLKRTTAHRLETYNGIKKVYPFWEPDISWNSFLCQMKASAEKLSKTGTFHKIDPDNPFRFLKNNDEIKMNFWHFAPEAIWALICDIAGVPAHRKCGRLSGNERNFKKAEDVINAIKPLHKSYKHDLKELIKMVEDKWKTNGGLAIWEVRRLAAEWAGSQDQGVPNPRRVMREFQEVHSTVTKFVERQILQLAVAQGMQRRGLTRKAGMLLQYIKDYYEDNGFMPTYDDMAHSQRMGRATIRRLLIELCEKRYLAKEGRSYVMLFRSKTEIELN